ncbi:MAG: glycosyltransferase family 4 protein [Armatimonadota bacterium]|nr:glycosyltransferase family 4 protein [Armatimonadota bacterium]
MGHVMKALLVIPSVVKTGLEAEVAADRHPTMDYHALATALQNRDGMTVDILDYAAVDRAASPIVRLARRLGGRDAALAMLAFQHRKDYAAIFSNGENVGIPLALLMSRQARSTGHVTIGHRLSAGKKQLFFSFLKAHRRLDQIFVYAQSQYDWGVDRLRIAPEKLALIPFHADDHFYRPMAATVKADQICSAGLEWRDYPTLIEAVASMPDLSVKLAAASPWSKDEDQTAGRALPPNVEARRYDYHALRALYAESSFVVVPLRETDFQAGVTTILEAMAMGKAVIATRTTGQTDVITDGENGLTVAPGDVAGWQSAISRLRSDAALRERLGRNARRWVEENATLDRWAGRLADAISETASSQNASGETRDRLPHFESEAG